MAAEVFSCKGHIDHVGFSFGRHFDYFHAEVADQLLLGGFSTAVLQLEGLI